MNKGYGTRMTSATAAAADATEQEIHICWIIKIQHQCIPQSSRNVPEDASPRENRYNERGMAENAFTDTEWEWDWDWVGCRGWVE
jgi:hypothetical protein